MRGPPGSLARSGLFRGPVASRSPRGRCKGFQVPGPDRESLAQGPALSIKTIVDASPHGRRGRRRKMTRLERAYPRRRTLGAVACLQCLLPYGGSCAERRSDRTCPGHPTAFWRDATTSRPPEDRSWWLAQERGETPPSPNPRPGPKDDAMRSLASSTPWRGFAGFPGLRLYVERTR